MDKEKRIDELIEIINELNYYYYTLDNPKVSDREYDQLYDELVALEEETGIIRDYSPTQRVGGPILEGLKSTPIWVDFGAWTNAKPLRSLKTGISG